MVDIKLFKKQAKWSADIARRAEVAQWIDFYNNRQEYYLKKDLDAAYPKSATELEKYLMTMPLTSRIIDDISILFKEELKVKIDKENLDDVWTDILANCNFRAVMDTVNRYVNLTYKVGIIPQWRDGVELDILTADNVFVIQDTEDPTKIEQLFYQVGIMENTHSVAEDVNVYVRWTADQQSICEIDDKGGLIKEYDEKDNRFGRIPIVWFQNDINVNNFWFDKSQNLVDTNRVINQELTNYRLMLAYQAFSTLVATGISEEDNISFGPQFSLKLPFDPAETKTPDAKYITPNPKLNDVWKVINDIVLNTAQSMGLSAEAYQRAASQFNSGYQLKLSKQDIINKTKQDRAYYRPRIIELCGLMQQLYTWNGAKNFPEDTKTIVDFGEIEFEMNPKEIQELRAMKLANGTASVIDFIMEDNPDLTREEAIDRYTQIQEEKRTYVIGGGIAEAMEVEE